MRYIFLLTMLFFLICGKAFAIELPFMNGNGKINVIFGDTKHESSLRPLIENLLKRKRVDLKSSEINLTTSKKARIEKEAIVKLLRSEGFYAAKVNYNINENNIIYNVNTGAPYLMGKVEAVYNIQNVPPLGHFGLKKGEVFRAEVLLGAIANLKKHLEQNNCLWEITVDYAASVNHPSHTANIVITVANSDSVSFGDISFSGLKSIQEIYLKSKLGFQKGDCFKRSKIEKARLNLFKTNLISSIENNLFKKDKVADVQFNIVERKHRTIKAGGGISSDEGMSVSAGWEHRNIFGKAQKLQLNTKLSELFLKMDTSLTIPSFLKPEQNLILKGEIAEENLDAFDATSIATSAVLKRKLGKYLTGSLGGQLKITYVEDNKKSETFGLLSFPLALDYDKRDNILNPKKGWLLSGGVSPFADILDNHTSFIKTSIGGSVYYTPKNFLLSPTFAVRGVLGSISGQNTDDIPADERFYAGGGGSVRGYPFQKLGPLDSSTPTGGRSFSELSLESRFNFSKDWGGVLFIDGGNAYEDITPDFEEGVRWAYGVGARYYTDFAPIRLDMAFPLERRRGIDDDFQFYISIGQAF